MQWVAGSAVLNLPVLEHLKAAVGKASWSLISHAWLFIIIIIIIVIIIIWQDPAVQKRLGKQ